MCSGEKWIMESMIDLCGHKVIIFMYHPLWPRLITFLQLFYRLWYSTVNLKTPPDLRT